MSETIRLDKWLWAARFFKTRALAQKNISQGKVHYNGQKGTPARHVQVGATLSITQGYDTTIVVVIAISDQRGPFSQAKLLYEETQESLEAKQKNKQLRQSEKYQRIVPKPDKRPDKHSRRKLRDIRRDDH